VRVLRDHLTVRLVDLDPGDSRLETGVLAVLQELRPHLTAELFTVVYREGHQQGLRYLAAYEDELCVGVAGWRFMATTTALRKLYVDDLVTSEKHRGSGVGKALIAELVERARVFGCRVFDLDSGVQRVDAHRFYMREGLAITSFHFVRRLD